LGEEVEPLPTVAEVVPGVAEIATLITAPAAGSTVQAIAASPGIAIGPAHIQVLQTFDYPLRGESCVVERERCKKP
jgi:multiphosphoryl transfer protein